MVMLKHCFIASPGGRSAAIPGATHSTSRACLGHCPRRANQPDRLSGVLDPTQSARWNRRRCNPSTHRGTRRLVAPCRRKHAVGCTVLPSCVLRPSRSRALTQPSSSRRNDTIRICFPRGHRWIAQISLQLNEEGNCNVRQLVYAWPLASIES